MSSVVLKTLAKPAGLPVLPPHADPGGDCLLRRLLADEPGRGLLPWPSGFEGGLAHRLDVSTSGAVAVADDVEHLAWLRSCFASGRLHKRYRLWAARDVPWDANRCDLSLAHDRRHRGRMVVRRGARTPHRGRWLQAETCFRRIEGRLWEATMCSGVMHQIRLHAAFLGIPILGDRRYGGGPTPADAPGGLSFYLHHMGFEGAGVCTAEVADPCWSSAARCR